MSEANENVIFKDHEDITAIHTVGLSLFDNTPTNLAVSKIHWVRMGPTFRNEQGNNAIHFHVGGEGFNYTDLSKTSLIVKLQITNEDGSLFKQQDGTKSAVLVDNILHSLWDHVDVKLNNYIVSFSTNNYMYKALFENLLFYSKGTRDYQTHAFGFYGESGDFSQNNPAGTPINTGLVQRYDLFKGKETIQGKVKDDDSGEEYIPDPTVVEFEGILMADIFLQPRYIPYAVDMDIYLQPNPDEFKLITFPNNTKARVKLLDVELKVCKVELDPAARLGIDERLLKEPAKYPFKSTEIRSRRISAGSYGATFDQLFEGYVPSTLLVGLVDSSAYTGNINMNPYHFQHFDIARIGFYVDNVPTPSAPIDLDITNGSYLEGYLSLYSLSGKVNSDSDIGINRTTYREGYTLFGFNTDPTTAQDMSYKGVWKTGSMKLELVFKKPLEKNITVVMYATFPDLMTINRERIVSVKTKERKKVFA